MTTPCEAMTMAIQAIFSDCGQFRYLIWEVWDESKPVLTWCLYNPSVAGSKGENGLIPDRTWTKGKGFSQRLGYGGQVFCNPFAFVSTYPDDLKKAGYPIGPENDAYILKACVMGDGKVVIAHGALGRGLPRLSKVVDMIRDAGYQTMALGFTSMGEPRHPLMLSYATEMVPYEDTL